MEFLLRYYEGLEPVARDFHFDARDKEDALRRVYEDGPLSPEFAPRQRSPGDLWVKVAPDSEIRLRQPKESAKPEREKKK